ncbi:ATP F0F1 synthase subunit B [Methylocapsa acidiphila]|uniref:F0F1 ATP synthase subunit B family protein n=1 Tax=Methylocapsa acidiphila TaxID=133552 RepID=UPI0003F6C297|nr:ATP F0F1 synthase subunit B [Methylocapsa acidiphila]
MFNEEFFVALGFAIFVVLLGYLGVHKKLGAALDQRGDRIKGELAEAERLRAEAEALLASYEKRRAEAEVEAQAVVAQARAEAELLAKEAHERTADFIQRRTKQAEEKIASAEAQAMAEVRAAAADAASKVAETVLKAEAKGALGEELISKGISDLKTLFH